VAILYVSPGTHTRLSDSLVAVALTREEVGLAQALLGRVAKLAAAAVGTNVKLMIDAEHTYFQPVSRKFYSVGRAAADCCAWDVWDKDLNNTYTSMMNRQIYGSLCAGCIVPVPPRL
jgi:hypothetical protein